jgi:hypothetical protein
MFLRNYQTRTLLILTALLFSVPWVTSAAGFIQNTIWAIVVAFFGLFLGLAALLLDFSINDYVIGFGKAFTTSGVGAAVDTLWYAVRDIFNLTFIFGLVFLGFKMILKSDDSNTRRWLVNLILAALLVNFSLFITKFIVDFSNIMATQIAQAFPTSADDPTRVSITEGFMNALGLQSLLGIKYGPIPGGIEGGGTWGYIFGSMMMFIVMTFVFAAGGVLILIRYAALCLYMVLSPLMFLGWVFPKLQSITDTYWRGFLGRAFFAPIYLLLVYFSYFVLTAMYKQNVLNGNPSRPVDVLNTNGGTGVYNSFAGTFPPFILTCIFLIASIVVANKMSDDAAGMGGRVNKWSQNKIKQSMRGGYRTAASQTGGRLARSGSYKLGNTLNNQINTMQKRSGVLGNIARKNGVDSAVRGGAEKMRGARFGLTRTVDQETEKTKSINKGIRERAGIEENMDKLIEAQTRFEAAASKATDSNLSEDERIKSAKERDGHDSEVKLRASKLTDKQIEGLTKADMERVNRHLSDKQLEAYYDRKGGIFESQTPQQELAAAKDAREEALFETHIDVLEGTTRTAGELNNAMKGLADTVRNLPEERLRGLSTSQLNDERIAMHLSDDQIKTLETSGNFSAADIKSIKDKRDSGIIKSIDGNLIDLSNNTNANSSDEATVQAFTEFKKGQTQNVFKRNINEIGKLPVSAFTRVGAFDSITPAMLEARIKNGISTEEKLQIREALVKYQVANYRELGDKNPWVKWEESNSPHAAYFYS